MSYCFEQNIRRLELVILSPRWERYAQYHCAKFLRYPLAPDRAPKAAGLKAVRGVMPVS